jgi:hypothetical protein
VPRYKQNTLNEDTVLFVSSFLYGGQEQQVRGGKKLEELHTFCGRLMRQFGQAGFPEEHILYCIGENNVHKKDVIHRERAGQQNIQEYTVLWYYVKTVKYMK